MIYYFSGGRTAAGLPPRSGYYVGYLVARGRAQRSLQQLAHLTAAEARPVVEAALAALSACPAPAN